jgi:hypothetical protein
VNKSVVDEVSNHLPQSFKVSLDRAWSAQLDIELAGRVRRSGVQDYLVNQSHHVDRLGSKRQMRIEASKQEEFLHELGHSSSFSTDTAHCVVQFVSLAKVPGPPEVGHALDCGHRGPQLVRSVGYKLTQMALDHALLVEHDIERLDEVGGLCAGRYLSHPSTAVTRHDSVGRLSHLCDRTNAEALDPEGGSGENEHDKTPRHQHGQPQASGGGVHLSERHRYEHAARRPWN